MIKTDTNRTLVIECASEACSVALFDRGMLTANEHALLGRGHAERLVPMIAALPDKGHAQQILVSLGPGSFTGVRIGIATARALGVAWGSTVIGYPTLTMVAATYALQAQMAPMTVCMNGGHGEWFVQNFDQNLLPQDNVRSVTPDIAVTRSKHRVITGNRATELAHALGADYQAVDLLPDAAAAILLPDSQLNEDLRPIYGREPDAKLPQMKQSSL